MNPTQYWPWPPMLNRPHRKEKATASAAEDQRRRRSQGLLEVPRRLPRVLARQPLVRKVEAGSLEDRLVRGDRVVAGEQDDETADQEGKHRGGERDEEAAGPLLDPGPQGMDLLGLRRRRRRCDAHATASRRPPVIAMPSSSSVTSGPYSPTISPAENDEDAVGERQNLIELERDEEDGSTLVALLDEPVVDELDRADVEPSRRLARHQDSGVTCDLAGDHDLLLVAAGERRGERRRRPATHVELLEQPAGERDQAARPNSQPKREFGLVTVVVEPDVLGEREVEDEPAPLPVLRDVADRPRRSAPASSRG